MTLDLKEANNTPGVKTDGWTDGRTDRQTDSDAYEPTVQCAQVGSKIVHFIYIPCKN